VGELLNKKLKTKHTGPKKPAAKSSHCIKN